MDAKPWQVFGPKARFSVMTLGGVCLQQFLFLNAKCKSLSQQRKRSAKIAWTTQYRKAHRKV